MDLPADAKKAEMATNGVWYHWSHSSAEQAVRPRLSDDKIIKNWVAQVHLPP